MSSQITLSNPVHRYNKDFSYCRVSKPGNVHSSSQTFPRDKGGPAMKANFELFFHVMCASCSGGPGTHYPRCIKWIGVCSIDANLMSTMAWIAESSTIEQL